MNAVYIKLRVLSSMFWNIAKLVIPELFSLIHLWLKELFSAENTKHWKNALKIAFFLQMIVVALEQVLTLKNNSYKKCN